MLELKHIQKYYNPGTVNEMCLFEDFNLTIQEGQFVSVVGSNGSGKTSMLNLICGSIDLDDGKILIDEIGRPKELYSTLAHHGCTRNEYFEWKVEGDFGQKEGCLFYDQGCRAPMTHSSCNKILWNDINSKTRAGMPCIGCTEVDFPRNDMLETKKNIGIPHEVPFGISKRAYLSITGIAKTFKIDRLHKKLME